MFCSVKEAIDYLKSQPADQQVYLLTGDSLVPEEFHIKEPVKYIPYICPPSQFKISDPCYKCSNHPRNGGSGICHCTLPYFNNPMKWDVILTTDLQ